MSSASYSYPKIYPQSSVELGQLGRRGFRREIADFLSLLVSLLRFVQASSNFPDDVDHHLSLARALVADDTVVSLNYDTLIDNALLVSGWDPSTGYGFNTGRSLKYGDVRRPAIRRREVVLLKPHGSLNWFARGSLQSLEDVLARRTPSHILMSLVPRAYNIASQGMVRLFIPPLYAKFFANPFWRALWEEAFARTVNAEMLLIIGCSMIESDFHLRRIMGRALIRRTQRFKEVVVVEPSMNVRRRLGSFLRGQSEHGIRWHDDFTDLVHRRLETT
jgi:hypothetical protein